MSLALDLVELDGKATPEAVAEEIFRQNPSIPVPVQVEEVASLSGIEQIQPLTSAGFEGMLVTNEHKTRGEIFFNPHNIPQRKRFTIGHELGHFLLPYHKQLSFQCTKEDMMRFEKSTTNHVTQEAEANRFASELLMPRAYFKRRMNALGEPEIQHIRTLSIDCDTSLEATAHRYANLSDYPCAVVFAKDKNVRYFVKSDELPYYLDVKTGSPLPRQSTCYGTGAGLGEWDEVDSLLWFGESKDRRLPESLLEQTLWQEGGFKIVLLLVSELPEEEE